MSSRNIKKGSVSMALFGTSGIRGVVFEKLTPDFYMDFGRALGSSLSEGSNVTIATDTRLSNDMLKSAISSGLLSSNINVQDLGIIPTPILAYLTKFEILLYVFPNIA